MTADGEVTAAASGVRPRRSGQAPPQIGRYTVLKSLGAGGMGVVHAAYDTDLDRKVAIKLLHDGVHVGGPATTGHSRLLREAQAMAKISHPNVLQVYEAGTHDGQVFLALELVEGSTLEAWLAAGPRSWRAVLDIFLQAGRGLQAAHEAGLIHRDFKPDNVLVDRAGRARVMDFGLARATGTIEPGPGDTPADRFTTSQLLTPLTATGSVMGTPLYMAPEQHLGGTTDPRTDEFAFCVTLYTALFGQRPFAGDDLKTLAFNVVQGRVREPPRDRKVPAFVRRAVLRGLAPDPADRFPDMHALLAELSRDPGAARRRWLLVAGAAALLLAGAWGFAAVQAARDQRCRGGEAALADTWGPARAAEVRAAFLATARPYAAATADRVLAELDARAAAWVGLHVAACEAHARGETSAELRDLQGACLERRRSETAALVDVFARADGEVVDRALAAALALTPVAGCDDRGALLARVKPPEDPTLAAEVLRLRALLDGAKAAQDAGKYKDGLAVAGAVVDAADATGHRPAIAEAYLRVGELHSRASDHVAAEKALWAALWAAEAGRHDEAAAAAWTELVRAAVKQGHHPDAYRWAERAGAAVARLGEDPVAQARLANEIGNLEYAEEKYDDAATHYREALDLRRAALGPDHPDVAAALANLGNALQGLGRFDEARAAFEESLALRERVLGPDHPDVAVTLNNLGVHHRTRGRLDEAMAALTRAREIWERALGPDNSVLLNAHMNIATIHRSRGELDQAQAELERAHAQAERTLPPDHPLRITTTANLGAIYLIRDDLERGEPLIRASLAMKERVYGPDHPGVAATLDNLGNIAATREHLDEAAALFTRALAILERRSGPEHGDLVPPLANLAHVEVERGDLDRADALARRALAITIKTSGPDAPEGDLATLVRARVELARRHPAAALALLDQAARHYKDHPPEPQQQAAHDFTRARALADTDPATARALATAALTYYRSQATPQPARLAAVEAWLARHR